MMLSHIRVYYIKIYDIRLYIYTIYYIYIYYIYIYIYILYLFFALPEPLKSTTYSRGPCPAGCPLPPSKFNILKTPFDLVEIKWLKTVIPNWNDYIYITLCALYDACLGVSLIFFLA